MYDSINVKRNNKDAKTGDFTNSDSPLIPSRSVEVIMFNTDAGASIINLPAGINGKNYVIKNVGSSTNDVTINPNGAENLFGVNTGFALADSETVNIYYSTTNGWW